MQVDTRNIQALHEVIKTQRGQIEVLTNRLNKLEANFAIMSADLINSKQMTAHVLGRGMGATSV